MTRGQARMPVILLLENGTSRDGQVVRQWLSDSRFMTCEAYDPFEVLEEMSDFTMRDRPDVIILNVDPSQDSAQSLRDIVRCCADGQDPAIISMTNDLSERGDDNFYAPDMSQVAARLEKLLPNQRAVAAN